MVDVLLSPAVGAGFWAGSLTGIVYAARRIAKDINEKLIPVMGVLGAFVFAAQMINFTIPGTGSSGHLGGGLLLSIILGPHAAFLAIASVLSVQALFFADGGLLALGCNIWNLGVYPCYVTYPLVYKMIIKNRPSPRRISFATVLASVGALQLGAFSVVVQTRLSGISELPFSSFLFFMQPIHLLIGLVEGIVTAAVVNYIRKMQPDILIINADRTFSSTPVRFLAVFALLTLLTGGVLSWYASTNPDGLEWSVTKIYGRGELFRKEDSVSQAARRVQEHTAVFPDYRYSANAGVSQGQGDNSVIDQGTSVSGIIGSIFVFLAVVLTGYGLRTLSRSRSGQRKVDS